MAAASGIWNHATPVNSLASAHPAAAAPTGSSGASSNDGSTISANDFLTLLVTEMQNQDPTANTDPNEYINQLVQVNSLEQLININQTLTTDLGSTTPVTGGLQRDPVTSPAAASLSATATAPSPSPTTGVNAGTPSGGQSINSTAGNLGVPGTNPAAQRVAQALTHRAHLD